MDPENLGQLQASATTDTGAPDTTPDKVSAALPLQTARASSSVRVGWMLRRQLTYLAFMVLVVGGVGLGAYYRFGPEQTCSDRIRNQDEAGIDCGGACSRICHFEVDDLEVGWSKVFPSGSGTYDVAALLVNPNPVHGVAALRYRFTLYDAQNKLIAEREGDTFVNPGEVLALYEPGIATGNRVPLRGYVQFQGPDYEIEWRKADLPLRPVLSVASVSFSSVRAPELVAQLANRSVVDALGVQAIAVLFDRNSIPLAVASTYIEQLAQGDTIPVTFLWDNEQVADGATEARVYPRSVVSGITF